MDTANQQKPSSLRLTSRVSHRYLSTNFAEQAFYLLLEIDTVAELPLSRLPLNLCLVLDTSTSMKGTRLQQVKQGVKQIISQLRAEDALSIVTFSDKSTVLLPSQRRIDQGRVEGLLSSIRAKGGTEMLQGLTAGLEQLQVNQTEQTVNHLIFLTDGQTYGDEEECLTQSRTAGHQQISLTTMGVGDDWNERLLDQMATASGGNSLYIDSPQEITEAFQTTLQSLSSVISRELTMQVSPAAGVTLREGFQITPHISRLDTGQDEVLLGPLAHKTGKVLLLEFHIDTAISQKQPHLANLTIHGEAAPKAAYRHSNSTKIIAQFAENVGRHTIPSAIVTALGKLAIFKMQEKAMHDLEQGEVTAATRRLETMATRLLNIGEAELARAALLEAGRLAHTGQLSAEGRKKIRYGTRRLSLLSKEVRS